MQGVRGADEIVGFSLIRGLWGMWLQDFGGLIPGLSVWLKVKIELKRQNHDLGQLVAQWAGAGGE